MHWTTPAKLALAVGLGVMPAAHSADLAQWQDGHGALGWVQISADRKSVTLCDTNDDDMHVEVEYATSFLRTIRVTAGPKAGCTSDNVFFGSITHAMFCYGLTESLRWCNPPVRF